MREPAGLQRLTLVEATRPRRIVELGLRLGTKGILLHAKVARRRLLLLGQRLRWRWGWLVLHERVRRPSLVLALGLAHEVERLFARHPRKVPKDLFRGGLQMIQQYRPRVLVEWLVAEPAALCRLPAVPASVEELAGEALGNRVL